MSNDTQRLEQDTPATVEQSPNSLIYQEPVQKKKRTILSWINLVLIIILFIALGFLAFLGWQQVQVSAGEMAVLRDRLEQTKARADALSASEQDILRQARLLTDSASSLKEQVEFNTDRLGKLPGAERQDWLLAETEYLLRLANQRLQLENDWEGAISMLTAADNVLVETRNPRMNPVRALIAREVLALRAVPAIDDIGAIHRLQALQEALEALPWIPERIAPSAPATPEATKTLEEQAWYWQILDHVKRAVLNAVRFRTRDEPIEAPLSPSQQYYLQQNMHLMLEQAQVALMRHQTDLYTHSLKRVMAWLDEYLVVEDEQTRAARASLEELQAWNVDPELPDISASLLKLQKLLEQQRRGTVLPKAKGAGA